MHLISIFVLLLLASLILAAVDKEEAIVNRRFDLCEHYTNWIAPKELVQVGFFAKRIDKDPDACYLSFNEDGDAQNKVNLQRGESFSFEMNEARKICKRYQATLVTIRTFEELQRVMQSGLPNGAKYVAMGATIRRTHDSDDKSYWEIVEWDDNLTSRIEFPPDRTKDMTSPFGKDDEGSATLVASFDETCKQCGFLVYWHVVKFQTGIDSKISLVCKQNLTTMKNNIPTRSPLIDDEDGITLQPVQVSVHVDMCNTKDRWDNNIHENIYGNMGANGICYFEIKDALDLVNTQLQPGYYHFSFKKARNMCHKYGSTLLTLRDYDEVLHAENAYAIAKYEFTALGVAIKRFSQAVIGLMKAWNGV